VRISGVMSYREKLIPFSLTAFIILLDQVTKWIVSRTLQYGRPVEVIGDFFRLLYVKNPAIAFSLGRNLDGPLQKALFLVLPLVVLIFLLFFYFLTKDLTRLQAWALAAIIGGGISNILDRIIKGDGVVDFFDFKFYNVFGLKRWPTFNVADMTVVIAGIILLASFIYSEVREKR